MYSPLNDIDQSSNWTLAELSREKAKEMTFSITYLSVITIVGVFGNLLVLKVFYFRFPRSTYRTFILVLAFQDCFSCAVGTPFCIAELFFAFTYTDAVSCRILRFILYYTSIASSMTLLLIAYERFRKICRPLKAQMKVAQAKKAICAVVGFFSVFSASPAIVLFGNQTIETGYRNTTGTRCFISDTYKDTLWPTAFNVYLVLLAIFTTAFMSVCYIFIARKVATVGNENVMRRNDSTEQNGTTMKASASGNSINYSDYDSENNTETGGRMSVQYLPDYHISKSTDNISVNSKRSAMSKSSTVVSESNKAGVSSKPSSTWKSAKMMIRNISSKSGRKSLRITKMLTIVTIAFLLSYTPHLTLMLWGMLTTQQDTLPTDNTYNVIFNSFFINNIVNPFIYAAMDLKFRRELKATFICLKKQQKA